MGDQGRQLAPGLPLPCHYHVAHAWTGARHLQTVDPRAGIPMSLPCCACLERGARHDHAVDARACITMSLPCCGTARGARHCPALARAVIACDGCPASLLGPAAPAITMSLPCCACLERAQGTTMLWMPGLALSCHYQVVRAYAWAT